LRIYCSRSVTALEIWSEIAGHASETAGDV